MYTSTKTRVTDTLGDHQKHYVKPTNQHSVLYKTSNICFLLGDYTFKICMYNTDYERGIGSVQKLGPSLLGARTLLGTRSY